MCNSKHLNQNYAFLGTKKLISNYLIEDLNFVLGSILNTARPWMQQSIPHEYFKLTNTSVFETTKCF